MSKYVQVALDVPLYTTFTYSYDLKERVFCGCRVALHFGNSKTQGIVTKIQDAPPASCPVAKDKIKPIEKLQDLSPLLTKELLDLGQWLSSYYICPIGQALFGIVPSAKKEKEYSGFAPESEVSTSFVTLSPEQKKATNDILQDTKTVFHYLYGKTGSGKTEVFLTCAKSVLQKGKGVIYLVPEIGLTPQVIKEVQKRFGQSLAILHSGLTKSQKLLQWHKILTRQARIVIGARSAVFAPVPDLGLIIIDEEHDPSYKSGCVPRYHARQVAMHRCSTLHIPLIMGSATPSVEAYWAIKKGVIKNHTLTKRLSGGAMPNIKTIDISLLKMQDNCICSELEVQIKETIAQKKQVILFLNRRGFSHFYRCNSCGFEQMCKNCSVPMTFHKSQKLLKCHYCGWSCMPEVSCPKCGSLDIGYCGFGTEFIEAEVRSKFPNAKVLRLDTDSITKKGELEEKLDAFRKGDYDILLGTQMVAKGLNFPKLQLVGVVCADTGLHMPDFRAAERTFSLITQVAGRAGRYSPDGKVIVQTYSPSLPPILYAAKQNINAFYENELKARQATLFPPYSRLIRLVFRSTKEALCLKTSTQAAQILQKMATAQKDIMILGPARSPIYKIAKNFRFQLLLKATKIAPLQNLVSSFIKDFKTPAFVYIEIDVDPQGLL